MKFFNLSKQKGVSLIIAFLIMTIMLAMVLSIGTILFNEIKIIGNIGNSVTSFYAADTGIEKTLYLDKMVLAPNSPNATANITSVGTVAWLITNNAKTSNNSYATAALSVFTGATSNYLKVTNFGFTIPAEATIKGITVRIERKATNIDGPIKDNRVRIVKGGVIGTTDKASAANWPLSDGIATYGSSTDLWGETWTVGDINASNFGVVVSAINYLGSTFTETASVDHITITVDTGRGLCNACNACNNLSFDLCNNCTLTPLAFNGCNLSVCNNCQLNYDSAFSGKTYTVSATVTPNLVNPALSDLIINSNGLYKEAARQIIISNTK